MEPTTISWMSELPQLAASSLVSSLWQGTVLAASVALALRLMPRATAAVRASAWAAVFAVLAVLPFFHIFAGHGHHASGVHNAIVELDVRWSYAIAVVWLAASLYRAGTLATSALRLRRIWKRATTVDAGAAASLMVDTRVEICTSEDVACPSVIGFFSPRILIPANLFGGLSQPELEHIVLHEMGHLRRRDDWINLLQKIGLVLFPLNPVLLWIERRLCLEREMACDDDVLRVTRAPKDYAKCLTDLAERRLGQRVASLSLGAWERQSELSRRVYSILRRGDGMSRTQARVVLGALVIGLVGGAAEVSRCPRLVSFAPSKDVQVAGNEPQSLPVEYRPVLATMHGAAHETLLRASMPSPASVVALKATDTAIHGAANQNAAMHGAVTTPATTTQHKRTRRAHAPALQRANQQQARVAPKKQFVVLTSWTEPDGSHVSGFSRAVITVVGEPGVITSYGAQSADGGWLVIQL
jgi:beta-lactamase regulating signal transducer with metallopeptidase domain